MAEATTATGKGHGMAVGTAIIGTIVGLLALYVVIAHLGGRSVPFVTDDRTAFIVLAVIGIVMCSFGIQTILRSTGLLSPGTFIGAVLGILVLIAFVLALLDQPMFLLPDYRTGFVALALVMLAKWCVATGSLIYSLVIE
jgi:hypothetical protein